MFDFLSLLRLIGWLIFNQRKFRAIDIHTEVLPSTPLWQLSCQRPESDY